MNHNPTTHSQIITLDGSGWRIATDPDNTGYEEKWFAVPQPDAKPATVPCTMQEIFPDSSGLAWYWKEFTAPANPHAGGRCLLRFWAVDYKADVWLNGKPLGTHLDAEEPFTLDATEAIRPGSNLLAVRVLNPAGNPIDGLTLGNTVRGCKTGVPGAVWNFGGILDSVELLIAPPVRLEDLHLITDWKSGGITAQANIRNAGAGKTRVRLILSVAPAVGGTRIDETVQEQEVSTGDTVLNGTLRVAQHRLWELDDPALYRVTARVEDLGAGSVDEQSDRIGFRDFRFEDGYFRLNGRRIFLRSAHTVWSTPVKMHSARDREMLRKDILYAKAMGFNTLRYLPFAAPRCQLDLADELGVMVMQQSMSSWMMPWPKDPQAQPSGAEMFDRSLLGIIRRDRNRPCVTMWCFLNETPDGPIFRHAVAVLPKVRELDDSRVCLLNSGRFDGQWETIGGLSNPGMRTWHAMDIREHHAYPPVPHGPDEIWDLRGCKVPREGEKQKTPFFSAYFNSLNPSDRNGPLFFSEYGIGSGQDLVTLTREFERLGAADCMEAGYYRSQLKAFMADWERLRLAEVFGRPEDYFYACQAANASQRTLGLNALRSNPDLVGHSMTAFFDEVGCGEGPLTIFRDIKPGALDALRDGLAPLRWCLFVEPHQLYRGCTVKIEALLANEDSLKPGDYEVDVSIFDPDERPVFKKKVTVTVRDPKTNPPFALPVLSEDVKIDGPAGRYRLAANFVSGAAAAGRPVKFYVGDPATMPPVKTAITLWGKDEGLERWLKEHAIAFQAAVEGQPPQKREVILVVGNAAKNAERFKELTSRIARGSTVVFLTPQAMVDDAEVPVKQMFDCPDIWNLYWLPLPQKGIWGTLDFWFGPGLYHRDDWARRHPIFDGLPCGGLMDWTFYRSMLPRWGKSLVNITEPDEAICGGINTCFGYSSGVYVGEWHLGAGRFIANCLNIRDNLGKDPVAELLLRNMLNYAARDIDKPLADLPADFDKQLESMGYKAVCSNKDGELAL
jgi:hypothetical protein